jgi:hypothetical protein
MDRNNYLEMCEQLGSAPIESEIPTELDDLTVQSQEVIEIFNYLPDQWGAMGGYLGKDLSNFDVVFRLFNVDESYWLVYLDLLGILIEKQVEVVNKKIEAKAKMGAKGGKGSP